MAEIRRGIIRMIVYILIFAGICTLWEIADVSMCGESQHSLMDLIAALFMSCWLDGKIWGDGNA